MLQNVMTFIEGKEMFFSYIYYSSILFILVVLINLFDRSKGILLMNDKSNFVLSFSSKIWIKTMIKNKQVSIIATALIMLVTIASLLMNNPYLVSVSVALLVWKVVSFMNPSKLIFSSEGIFVVDFLVLGDRKGFFDYVEWSEVKSMSYKSEKNELTILVDKKRIVLPISTEQYSELTLWLDNQYNDINNKIKKETTIA